MSQPTREEVKTFILALRYGMKVTHKPDFLIALAEGWLANEKLAVNEAAGQVDFRCCNGEHKWVDVERGPAVWNQVCVYCGLHLKHYG